MDPTLLGVIVLVGFFAAFFTLRSLWSDVVVHPHTIAFVYSNGKVVKRLEAGRHRVFGKEPVVSHIDPRPFWIHVAGQELVTSDGAPVRVSVSCHLGVADIDKYAAARDPLSDMYARIQLELRDCVVGRTLDAMVQERDAIDARLHEGLAGVAQAQGMVLEQIKIRDVTFVGETKRAYADLVNAQLKARAALERARGEAAAMRSLMNTVELVRKNPELIHLRALQGMEQGNATVQIRLGEPTDKSDES